MVALHLFVVFFAVYLYLYRIQHLPEWIGLIFVSWVSAYVSAIFVQCILPKKKINPDNKAVFITGCDSGFGNQLAKRLDALGFHVYAGCLFNDKEGASNLRSACSKRLHTLQLDVTSDEQVKAAVKEVQDTLEGKELWAIVNNAGIATYSETEWCPIEVYKNTLEVNAFGPVRITKSFLPLLRRFHGRVVIVASLAGRYSTPGLGAYSMSKFAAVAFAECLRYEMIKWGITVHTIEPALYNTPISDYDRLLAGLKRTWDSASDEIRADYGQEYFQAFQKSLLKTEKLLGSDNIQEVVQCMIDAVHDEKPQARYIPGVANQLAERMFSFLPERIQDFLLIQALPKCPLAALKKKL